MEGGEGKIQNARAETLIQGPPRALPRNTFHSPLKIYPYDYL